MLPTITPSPYLSLGLSPNILWILLGISAILFIIISLILIYHWIEFGANTRKIITMIFIYLSVGFALLATALVALSYYQITI